MPVVKPQPVPRPFAVGDDVTDLMNGTATQTPPPAPVAPPAPRQLAVGDDVTALMNGGASAPVAQTAPVTTPARQDSDGFRSMGDTIADVAAGVGKGALNTAVGLGNLLYHVPGVKQASDAVQRVAFGDVQPAGELFDQARRELEPTNTAQKVGYYGEQIGEFFIPGAEAEKAASWMTTKLAPHLKDAPKAVRTILTMIPRMSTEAASSAAVTAAQGGDAGSAAAFGAAGPVVGKVATESIGRLKKGATTAVVQALGPTKERFKSLAEKIAPEFLKRDIGGMLGKSREGVYAEARDAAIRAGEAIDDHIQQIGDKVVNTKPIVDALEEAKAAYKTQRVLTPQEAAANPALAKRAVQLPSGELAVDVILDQRPIRQLERLQRTINELGPNATAQQVIATRRAWDYVVNQAGGYAHRAPGAIGVPLSEMTETWAKREATTAIRKVLAEEFTTLAKLNKEFTFWRNLEDVVGQTMKRTAPQKSNLREWVFAGGAVASGGGAVAMAEKALFAKKFAALVESPRWKLISARIKDKMADALATGDMPGLRDAFQAATRGTVSAQTRGQ